MLYSKSTGGFYLPEINGSNIPADAVAISVSKHAELLQGQSSGKVITAGSDGKPVLTDPPVMPAPVPTSLTMKQARLALLAGGYLDAVEAGVSAMPRASQIAWEFAATVDRTDPLTATLAAALKLNSSALDALFSAGAEL